jgi:hypothetical protein
MSKALIFAGIAVVFVLAAVHSNPSNVTIWWGRSKIVEKIPAGEAKKVELVFSSTMNLDKVSLDTSGNLANFVTQFAPTILEKVSANQPVKFDVFISVSSDTAPGTYGGTIHIKQGKKTIPSPLTVNIIVLPSAPVPPQPPPLPSWTSLINISKTTIQSYRPKVAQDYAGNVYVFWLDSNYSTQYELYFSKLENGGNWTTPQVVISTDGYNYLSNDFDFIIDKQNRVHLVYAQYASGSGPFVYYTVFDGTDWSVPYQVCQGDAPSIDIGPDNKVHLVYNTGSQDVYYTSFDGNSWLSPINVSNDGNLYGDSTMGAKAMRVDDSGIIHIAWAKTNYGIMYVKFDSTTWSQPQLISPFGSGLNNYWLSLGANGVIAAAYTYGPNDCIHNEIYFSKSDDGGATWFDPEQISGSPGSGSKWPSLAIVNSNNIQAVWGECSAIVPFRLFNGQTWSEIIDISNGTQGAGLPNIFATQSKTYVVWDYSGEIYFSQSQ